MAMASLARRRAAEAVLLRRPQAAWASAWRGYAASSGEESDVVVIGGGPGGYVAAIKAAQMGLKTTCIEKRGTLGGTCLNVGCIPSKVPLRRRRAHDRRRQPRLRCLQASSGALDPASGIAGARPSPCAPPLRRKPPGAPPPPCFPVRPSPSGCPRRSPEPRRSPASRWAPSTAAQPRAPARVRAPPSLALAAMRGPPVSDALAMRENGKNALLHSSHMYHEAKASFAHHGIKFSNLEIDLPAMMSQKDKAVSGLTKGIEGLFKKNKVEYVKGFGKFVSPSGVSVDLVDGGSTVVKGKNIIIATGSDVKSLPGVTIDEKKIVSSTGALALSEIPKKLVVIGAGYIGLEMGSVWNRLGSEVTVVEFAPDIVPSMDGEIRKQFQRMLEKQKMKFMLKTKVIGIDTSGSGVKLTVEPSSGGDQSVLDADIVLVSAGRIPYTAGLGLDTIGVETDKVGRILVDKRFMTNIKGVYAIGDAIPGPMLAHKAEEDGVACVEFIAGKEGHVDYDTVPGVVYTHPEVASVGKTEEQVKASGVAYQVGKFPLLANSRAKAIDDAEGLVKVVADKETDRILGVHIMAPNAGEIIHEAVLALQYGASSEDIARTCHAHPTVSEALKEACLQTYLKAIHI